MGLKNRNISLKYKFVIIILVMVVVSFALMGTVCYLFLGSILDDASNKNLNHTVQQYALQIDNKLYRIEDEVNGVEAFVSGSLESSDEIADSDTRMEFQKDFEQYFVSVAGSNPDVTACYMTFNPELTGDGTQGFYYCKNSDGVLAQSEVTDVLKFSSVDMDEAGWFYRPLEKREALWIEPYYSDKCGAMVISYVVPIYKGDVLIGVVGIDMDFDKLVSYVGNFTVLDGGEAYIKSKDGSIHYLSNTFTKDKATSDKDYVITGNVGKMTQVRTDKSVVRYEYEGTDNVMAFDSLSNGMKLVIHVESAEAYSARRTLLGWIFAFGIVLGALMLGVAYYYASRLTRSLRDLTEASHKIANGDFKTSLPEVTTNDEVADLTRSMKTVVESLKTYTVNMESKAFVDQMTKVKNKSAYNGMVESIDEQIKDGVARFAVVMCDLNYLKVTNDRYGHNAGDEAITRAAHIICEHFPLSQVFRIGGDEFVVILTEHDFKIRQKLIYDFGEHLKELGNEPGDIHNISLSFGASEFHAGEDLDYNAVFKRADERMYQMKQELHRKHGIGLR